MTLLRIKRCILITYFVDLSAFFLRTPTESSCTELYEMILTRDQNFCSLLVLVLIESSFLKMFFGHPFILFSLEIIIF
jgi:hypothetical protein